MDESRNDGCFSNILISNEDYFKFTQFRHLIIIELSGLIVVINIHYLWIFIVINVNINYWVFLFIHHKNYFTWILFYKKKRFICVMILLNHMSIAMRLRTKKNKIICSEIEWLGKVQPKDGDNLHDPILNFSSFVQQYQLNINKTINTKH